MGFSQGSNMEGSFFAAPVGDYRCIHRGVKGAKHLFEALPLTLRRLQLFCWQGAAREAEVFSISSAIARKY